MTPTRQRLLVTLLAAASVAGAVLAGLYLAVWADSLRIHHCQGWGNWPYGWDVFSSACGREESRLGLPELAITVAPGLAALALFGASLLSDGKRKIAMPPALGVLAACSLGSNWGYIFLPSFAFAVAAVLLVFEFNPLAWFLERLTWRLS